MAEELLNAETHALAPRKGALRGLIAKAGVMSGQADLEPRYWRGAWPEKTYAAGVHALTCLRFNLATIDYALVDSADTAGDDRPKTAHFLAASNMKEFNELREMLEEQMHFIETEMNKRLLKETIVDVFDGDNAPDEALQSSEKEALMRKKLDEWAVAVSKNQEVMKEEEDSKNSKFKSLENDAVADMCILYGCLSNIISELEAVHEALAGS